MNLFTTMAAAQMDGAGFAERFRLGGSTLIFGMLVVFSVLLLIWGVLELFHYVFNATQKKQKATPAQKPKPKVTTPPPVPAPVAVQSKQADDDALVAAITAALMMTMQKDASAFRVVSFRRVNKTTPWNRES